MNNCIYQRFFKRVIDIVVSITAIILLSPLILIIAILIRFKLGKPIIFKQNRPGKNEKIFRLYKFRTMTEKRDENGFLLSDSSRLTRFGRILRSMSLDELPSLLNILKGDMSVVGPRPLLVEYLSIYDSFQRRRHEIKPGLTGLAQISGRNSLDWNEKFKLDIKYVDSVSFLLDIKIIIKTFIKVIKKEGINSRGSVTMEKFTRENNKY